MCNGFTKVLRKLFGTPETSNPKTFAQLRERKTMLFGHSPVFGSLTGKKPFTTHQRASCTSGPGSKPDQPASSRNAPQKARTSQLAAVRPHPSLEILAWLAILFLLTLATAHAQHQLLP
jgi:hypothetical protein